VQEEGEQFALHSPERLWALVTFDSGPSHEGLTDYTIRMNYTTVPRTWLSVNKWSHHLKVSDISFDMSAGDRQATRPTTPAMRCTRQMAAASSCEEAASVQSRSWRAKDIPLLTGTRLQSI